MSNIKEFTIHGEYKAILRKVANRAAHDKMTRLEFEAALQKEIDKLSKKMVGMGLSYFDNVTLQKPIHEAVQPKPLDLLIHGALTDKPNLTERVGVMSIEDVFARLHSTQEVFGVKVRFNSKRYECFKQKGVLCLCCGIVGHYFGIERHTGQTDSPYFHLNLYHKTPDGKEIMITADHIIPLCENGEDRVSNMQTLCEPCNNRKDRKTIDYTKPSVVESTEITVRNL